MSVFDEKFWQETPEFGGDNLFHLGQRDGMTELYLHRRDRAIGDAARDDAAERSEVGVHVERETVVGGPLLNGDADRSDFAGPEPDPGFARATISREAERADRVDQHLFNEAEIRVEILARSEIYDRITDDLTGPVIRDVAPTIALGNGNAPSRKLVDVPNQMLRGILAHAERVNGIVFRENESIGNFTGIAPGDEAVLTLPGVVIDGMTPVESRRSGVGGNDHRQRYSTSEWLMAQINLKEVLSLLPNYTQLRSP